MKTIILAAGRGSRLNTHTQHTPKPLVPVEESIMLNAIIDNCRLANLHDFIIVVGYLQESVKEHVFQIHDQAVFVENPEYDKKDNGYSAYQAKEAVGNDENFLLLMGDHMFDPSLLQKLLTAYPTNECVLAIDKNLSQVHDVEEATKVLEKDGYVEKIGKTIEEHNAVDTGFFLCTQDLFRALEACFHQNLYKLADAMQQLAKERKLQTKDISGSFWIDVDTEENLMEAKKHLPLWAQEK